MLRRTLPILIAGLALMALAGIVVGPQRPDGLRRVSVPNGGICPDVAVDARGVHLVYARKNDVYYTDSRDGGRIFSKPLRVNPSWGPAVVGHERGPRIALGKDGTIHVVWMVQPGGKILYTRSTDAGQHFSEPRNLAPETPGVDGATITADDAGRVYVGWLGGGEGPESPVSSLIQLAYSTDNGSTFTPARTLQSNYPGGACACCALKAAIGPDHKLLVGFRGAYHNIRDIYLLEGTADANRFAAIRISDDRWYLEACPMVGPSVEATANAKQILVSWMSQGQVYYAISKDGGESFSGRTEPAQRQTSPRRFPIIRSNARGELLFAWVQGQSVRWEMISPEGRILQSGENGHLPSDSKLAAFVDRDSSFVLVY